MVQRGEIRTNDSPHIFIGASSSSSIGWLMKISLAFVQRCLISYSASWTGFPGRLPRTASIRRQRFFLHVIAVPRRGLAEMVERSTAGHRPA